jgi:hypothetical protein
MLLRARYLLIGGLVLVIAGSLIGGHFWGDCSQVLKPDGGPIVTTSGVTDQFDFYNMLVFLSETRERLANGAVYPVLDGWHTSSTSTRMT